jgi:hypothetical protein
MRELYATRQGQGRMVEYRPVFADALLERRRGNQRKAARFAVEATDFDFVEQQRRSDQSARNAALRRTKRSQRRTRKTPG